MPKKMTKIIEAPRLIADSIIERNWVLRKCPAMVIRLFDDVRALVSSLMTTNRTGSQKLI
ncbi:hypothetical protein D3C75_1358470 [compost metagenome]